MLAILRRVIMFIKDLLKGNESSLGLLYMKVLNFNSHLKFTNYQYAHRYTFSVISLLGFWGFGVLEFFVSNSKLKNLKYLV